MNMESTKPAQTGTYASRIPENPQDILDRRFSRFALHPLTDSDVWTLAMAAMVMPDGNPGAEAYLAQVSGTDLFHGRLTVWGRVVALGIAHASYKARNGVRRREYVEGYDTWWGEYAVADGLSLALYGKAEDALGRGAGNYQGYIRIRDFVGGTLVSAIAEYRVALEWAAGYRRDRVLAGRWEGITGLNYRDAQADASMGGQGVSGLMFAPGCKQTPAARTDLDTQDRKDPETLYHSLRPTDWWDASYAKAMRDAPIRMIYPE